VYEWDAASGTQLRSVRLATGSISTLAAAADGKTLLVGLEDHEFLTVSTDTLQLIAHVRARGSAAERAVFSPDSAAFVTAINPNELEAWGVHSGELLASAGVDSTLNFNQFFFGAGGTRLVTAGDTEAWVYTWPGLGKRMRLPRRRPSISTLVPIGDDHHFLSIGSNVLLWDINQGRIVSEGTVDGDHLPRIVLPRGMRAALLTERDGALRLLCNGAAQAGDPLGFVQSPR
jgi:hypothetical protein